MCVQLETDPSLLMKKANESLSKYGVNMVIANLLQTRKDEIILVAATGAVALHRGDEPEIEKSLIKAVVDRHTEFEISRKPQRE